MSFARHRNKHTHTFLIICFILNVKKFPYFPFWSPNVPFFPLKVDTFFLFLFLFLFFEFEFEKKKRYLTHTYICSRGRIYAPTFLLAYAFRGLKGDVAVKEFKRLDSQKPRKPNGTSYTHIHTLDHGPKSALPNA